jgi:hypothetical protein
MVCAAPPRDASGMDISLDHEPNIATSTFELRRAATHFRQGASAPGVVAGLPLALTDIETTLERLADGLVEAADAVEPSTEALSPEARTLRWHLFHLAARLRSTADTAPDARRSARTLLDRQDLAHDEEQVTAGVSA